MILSQINLTRVFTSSAIGIALLSSLTHNTFASQIEMSFLPSIIESGEPTLAVLNSKVPQLNYQHSELVEFLRKNVLNPAVFNLTLKEVIRSTRENHPEISEALRALIKSKAEIQELVPILDMYLRTVYQSSDSFFSLELIEALSQVQPVGVKFRIWSLGFSPNSLELYYTFLPERQRLSAEIDLVKFPYKGETFVQPLSIYGDNGTGTLSSAHCYERMLFLPGIETENFSWEILENHFKLGQDLHAKYETFLRDINDLRKRSFLQGSLFYTRKESAKKALKSTETAVQNFIQLRKQRKLKSLEMSRYAEALELRKQQQALLEKADANLENFFKLIEISLHNLSNQRSQADPILNQAVELFEKQYKQALVRNSNFNRSLEARKSGISSFVFFLKRDYSSLLGLTTRSHTVPYAVATPPIAAPAETDDDVPVVEIPLKATADSTLSDSSTSLLSPSPSTEEPIRPSTPVKVKWKVSTRLDRTESYGSAAPSSIARTHQPKKVFMVSKFMHAFYGASEVEQRQVTAHITRFSKGEGRLATKLAGASIGAFELRPSQSKGALRVYFDFYPDAQTVRLLILGNKDTQPQDIRSLDKFRQSANIANMHPFHLLDQTPPATPTLRKVESFDSIRTPITQSSGLSSGRGSPALADGSEDFSLSASGLLPTAAPGWLSIRTLWSSTGSRTVTVKDVPADGACLFHSLQELNEEITHANFVSKVKAVSLDLEKAHGNFSAFQIHQQNVLLPLLEGRTVDNWVAYFTTRDQDGNLPTSDENVVQAVAAFFDVTIAINQVVELPGVHAFQPHQIFHPMGPGIESDLTPTYHIGHVHYSGTAEGGCPNHFVPIHITPDASTQ